MSDDLDTNARTSISHKFTDLMNRSGPASSSHPLTPPRRRNGKNRQTNVVQDGTLESPDPLQHSQDSVQLSMASGSSSATSRPTRTQSNSPLRQPASTEHSQTETLVRPRAGLSSLNELLDATSEAESPDPMRIEISRPKRAQVKTYGKGGPKRVSRPVAMPLSDNSFVKSSSPGRTPTRQLEEQQRQQQDGESSAPSSPSKRQRTPQKTLNGTSSPWNKTTIEDVFGGTTPKADIETVRATSVTSSPEGKRPSRNGRATNRARTESATAKESESELSDLPDSDDDSDAFKEEITASPRKKVKQRQVSAKLPPKAVKTSRKGRESLSRKDKGKKWQDEEHLPPSQTASPVMRALPAPSTSSQSPLKTNSQQDEPTASWDVRLELGSGVPKSSAESFSLARMDKLVWTLVGGKFWWPGDIVSVLRSERPLKVRLLQDKANVISRYEPDGDNAIADPSPSNIASFRSGARIRHGINSFVEDDFDDREELETAFVDVLRQATGLERSRDFDDEEEDESLNEANGPSAFSQALGDDEDDTLLQDDATEDDLSCPSYALVKSMRHWWPARLDKLIDEENAEDEQERKHVGKYAITWCDWTTHYVTRKVILAPSDRLFHEVEIGETVYDHPRFSQTLKNFVERHSERWQKIINENFDFAQRWNDAFYAGGRERDGLARDVRFGELNEDHIDRLSQAILQWAEPDEDRPRGTVRYEQLRDVERSRYRNDVLLPLVALGFMAEDFGEVAAAEAELRRGNTGQEVSDDGVINRAYELTMERLSEASISKAVLAMRQTKTQAQQTGALTNIGRRQCAR
ncbi:hypothetical protein ACM66B_005224 [Microbotryomycetes sp. NB124-2]